MPRILARTVSFGQRSKTTRPTQPKPARSGGPRPHPNAPPRPDLAHPVFHSKSFFLFPFPSNNPMKNYQEIPEHPRLTATDERGYQGSDDVIVRIGDLRGRTWTRNADFEEGYM